MATLKSIAAEAGVSPMVVSAVVHNDFRRIRVSEPVREKIRRLIEKHNYVPSALARSLSRRATNLVTIFIPSLRFFEVPLQRKMLTAFHAAIEPQGYRLSFCTVHPSREHTLTDILADAGLFFYYGPPNDPAVEQIRRLPFPLIIFGPAPYRDLPVLHLDSRRAMAKLTEAVIARGHRRILYVRSYTGNVQNQNAYAGIKDVLGKHPKVEFEARKIYWHSNEPAESHHADLGREAARQILEMQPRPSLVMFETDFMALCAVQELKRHGLTIPGDISITTTGHDAHTDLLEPPLAKITCDAYAVGRRCAEAVLAALKGELSPRTTALPMQINWGKSVADAPS